MRKLIERAFCNGIAVGISLYQRMIVSAHERKKPLKIGDTLYYLETGRERLERVLNEMKCYNKVVTGVANKIY